MKRIIMLILTVIAMFAICITGYAEEVSEETPDNTVILDVSKIGDANDDGKISAADARIVLRISAKLEQSPDEWSHLDINADQKLAAADARILLRISAKLDSIENYSECILHGHDMIKKVVSPTCTNEGYTTNKCSRCSYTDGTKINVTSKIAHNYKLDNSVKATCKSEGYDLYKCTVCDTTKKDNVQSKTAHSFKKGSVVKGTCISDGYTEYKCSVCGAIEKRDVTKAGGHKYEYVSKEPFETSDFFWI